ncbi:MAG: hypothetical protein JWO82_449, partial [Akkermansiaceae bacterium]|nr:hypothetical protein [Akkermansiaceae bacterium]
LLLLTHATALLAGWAMVSRTHFAAAGHDPAAVSPAKPPPGRKTAPREPETAWSAAEILREVDQATPVVTPSEGEDYEITAARKLREELAKNGTDAHTAFEGMLAKVLEMEHSPSTEEDAPAFDYVRIRTLLAIMAQNQDTLSLAAYLGKSPRLDSTIMEAVASAFAPDASFEKLQTLKAAVTPELWENYRYKVAQAWPAERRDDLLKWAVSENRPELLNEANSFGDSAGWLVKISTDPSVPENFRTMLKNNPATQAVINMDPAIPVAARLEADKSTTVRTLAWLDIDKTFRGPVDWMHRFQTGQATPEEVRSAVTAATPLLAATHPGELNGILYTKLAEADPQRALTLLEGLPADQRAATIVAASANASYGGAPDQFLTMLSQAPDTPETRDQRLLAWELRSQNYLQVIPGDYLHWLDRMPAGIDRDLALYAAAENIRHSNPAQAAEMRSRIADPDLQQRNPKTR